MILDRPGAISSWRKSVSKGFYRPRKINYRPEISSWTIGFCSYRPGRCGDRPGRSGSSMGAGMEIDRDCQTNPFTMDAWGVTSIVGAFFTIV
ncbi:hypothetical protein MA16_Dca007777 [Dendrobium catenatum]|uniref:Uncharacterized protein n=1 Tax=Dendrobium catenatum TaxID=906689 RepID=A0A2I0X5B8_9ASPA|nr:hypothetical protein MA16_Dca007777 [Dendrobium catenatum]